MANLLEYYGIPFLLLVFLTWRYLRVTSAKSKLPELLSQGAIILDVRNRVEFAGGAKSGSINIPLDELSQRLEELDPKKPVVLCCASGTRSAIALGILKKRGFERLINVGSWRNTL